MKKFLMVLMPISLILLTSCGKTITVQDEITVDEVKEHVAYLASEELEGRKPGTEGGLKAAEYIREQLQALDVKLLGENGFQYFNVTTDVELGDNNSLRIGGFEGTPGEDYITVALSENGTVSAEVVFAGYGFNFENDSLAWNDFETVDVKDKWALILRGSPAVGGDNPHAKDPFSNYSSMRAKVLAARDAGAAGIIFVNGSKFDEADELYDLSRGRREFSAGLPAIHVKREIADRILASDNKTVEELESFIIENEQPASYETGIEVSAATDLKRIEVQTQNVVAMLEGNDPELKNEIIVIGGHYDHLGYGGFGSGSRAPDSNAIHFGADDNASGTASIIETFEKLAANRDSLERSVLFIAFGAEEMGLLGSKHFINNLLVDKEDMVFMYNLDMMGKYGNNDMGEFTIGGTGTAEGLKEFVEENLEEHGLKAQMDPGGYGPSDHSTFYGADIPVLFFFSGAHDDYHTPRDTPEKLDYDGIVSISNMVYDMILEMDNMPEQMKYLETGSRAPQGRMRFKVTLGIMPAYAPDPDHEGLRVDAVFDDKPGAIAGLKKGDYIISIDGKEVKDIEGYMVRLMALEPGTTIPIVVIRNGEEVELQVEL